jgi:hypothetical protein
MKGERMDRIQRNFKILIHYKTIKNVDKNEKMDYINMHRFSQKKL